MSWTLSSLKTAIQDYAESTESSFVTHLPDFIKSAEERILKNVQLDVFKKNVTGSGTASNTYLAMPTDFLAPFSLAVIDSDNNYNYLLLKHVSFIRDYTPASATTALPKYYAEFDQSSFILAPAPNSNYNFELHYFYRPTSLTATATGTTWLSTNATNALLYGSLVEANTYLKTFETTPVYEARFQEALASLKNLGEGKSTRDENRYDEVRRTPQS
jgi:ribosomal protein S20